MAEKSESHDLELRVQELENQLQALAADDPVDISADELAAYKKVSRAIGCARCGRGCAYCIAAASDALQSSAVMPCACGRCGRGCGYCGYPCIATASEDISTSAAMPCGRCGRGCGYCGYPCIATASEDISPSAAMPCGRCGRGCTYCIAAASEDISPSAVACRCGRGCGYCYQLSSDQSGPRPEARMLGHAGTSPIARFGRLGK